VLARTARAGVVGSRLNADLFLLGATHGGRLLTAAGPAAAVSMIEDAYRRVPAYRAFLDSHGGLPRRARGQGAQDWLALLPTTSKATYIDAYGMLERCWDGRLPERGVEVDESAGSSGKPYQWVRSAAELKEVHRTLELLAGYLLDRGPDAGGRRQLITINAFSMGAWSTGVNVSAALKRMGVLKSCGPDVEKILAVLTLFGPAPRYTLCGYPPFLETVADGAARAGIDLDRYDVTGFVGGEGMSEGMRERLQQTYTRVWSAYGASDLDIGVAAETPLSVWLRQAATRDPALAEALFGTTTRVPMCFQYDPSSYHLETVEGPFGAEVVATVLRPTLSPRLRYAVGDAGGVLPLPVAVDLARGHGHDPTGADGLDPTWGRQLDLPFLFIHGRADSTLSYMGANLYPEDVGAGLDDGRAEALRLGVTPGAFCLELVGDQDPRPCIHVEVDALPEPAQADRVRTVLTDAVRDRLARDSADYRAALQEDPRAARLEVRLHPTGTGPFVANSTRIKRRYIVRPEPADAPPSRFDISLLPPAHVATLTDALRAPSAHNAQPWRLAWLPVDGQATAAVDPTATQRYALTYDHTDYLPYDPDDRDAYLCMGALFETLRLAAVRHGLLADLREVFARSGTVLHVVDITLRPLADGEADGDTLAMAALARDRHTNRSTYTGAPLPQWLCDQLSELGCSLVPPRDIARLCAHASALSWRDRRFVADLERFCSDDESAPRGMTPGGLMLARYEWHALRAAFALGRLPGPLGTLYSGRDIRLVRTAPAVAVLGAESLEPRDLFAAGRRLLRTWSVISGSGFAYHPVSVSVDRPETAPLVAEMSGIAVPAAVFRVGRPSRAAGRSNRVGLADVLTCGGPEPADR
jgi:phenylacetate-CoA ligase